MESYENFRTGLTFRDVRGILDMEKRRKYDNGEYMWITRHTVLGKWHEIKLRMYREEKEYIESIPNKYNH